MRVLLLRYLSADVTKMGEMTKFGRRFVLKPCSEQRQFNRYSSFSQRLAEILGEDSKRRSRGKDYWLVRIKTDNDLLPVTETSASQPAIFASMEGQQYKF